VDSVLAFLPGRGRRRPGRAGRARSGEPDERGPPPGAARAPSRSPPEYVVADGSAPTPGPTPDAIVLTIGDRAMAARGLTPGCHPRPRRRVDRLTGCPSSSRDGRRARASVAQRAALAASWTAAEHGLPAGDASRTFTVLPTADPGRGAAVSPILDRFVLARAEEAGLAACRGSPASKALHDRPRLLRDDPERFRRARARKRIAFDVDRTPGARRRAPAAHDVARGVEGGAEPPRQGTRQARRRCEGRGPRAAEGPEGGGGARGDRRGSARGRDPGAPPPGSEPALRRGARRPDRRRQRRGAPPRDAADVLLPRQGPRGPARRDGRARGGARGPDRGQPVLLPQGRR
jgi:hypothetical protein